MRKSLSYKILAAVLALTAINYALPANTTAGEVDGNYYVDYDGENVKGNYNTVYGNEHSFTFEGEASEIYGSIKNPTTNAISNINITVNNSNVSYEVQGVYSESNNDITNNHVTINSSKDLAIVCGASSSGGKVTNNYVTINDSEVSYEVCGGASTNGEVSNNYVIINESTINNINKNTVVRGGASDTGDVFGNHVTINGGTLNSVQGGFSNTGNVNDNHVTISNATITGSIVGGYNRDNQTAKIQNNSITIKGTTDISNASLHGYATLTGQSNITAENNRLILDGWDGNNGTDNYNVGSLNNFNIIEFKNIKANTGLTAKSVNGMNDTQLILSSVDVTNLSNATNHIFGTITLTENITNVIKDFTNNIDANALNGWNFNDNETSGVYAGYIANATAITNNNTITITGNVENSVLTGKFIDENGNEHYKGSSTPDDTTDDSTTLTIGNGFDTKVATVAGVYAAGSKNATDGVIYISGDNITYKGTVYAGYSESGSASGNIINVAAGTNAKNMTLSGTYNTGSDNVLNLAGSATFKAINKFNAINFDKIDWINGGTVLNITNNAEEKALANTNINLKSLNFAGGAKLNAGESMTIISNNDSGKDLGIGKGTGKVNALSNFTAGVAIEGTGTAEVASDGNSVKYTLTKVKHTDQIDLVAENRAVAAAFVIIRHKDNIKRLLNGTESKIRQGHAEDLKK